MEPPPSRMTDHPHARGENTHSCPSSVPPLRTIPTRVGSTPDAQKSPRSTSGPSPRAWGALLPHMKPAHDQRTIPTRVGSTVEIGNNFRFLPDHPHARGEHYFPARIRETMTDHPHARGEHETVLAFGPRNLGPSPRAWGSRRNVRHSFDRQRTIPTRVGSTLTVASSEYVCADHPHARGEHSVISRCQAIRTTDHPHARGEHILLWMFVCSLIGPSPRAWGAQSAMSRSSSGRRTIPTRVGSTRPSCAARRESADHPHARGEHQAAVFGQGATGGPSPRAWGEPISGMYRASRFADHPHARGEHSAYSETIAVQSRTIPTRVGSTPSFPTARACSFGPSPRAWGARCALQADHCTYRTIPTRVGSTTVRGRASLRMRGPSPRAWGERLRLCERRSALRTIPTRVGSTLVNRAAARCELGPSPRAWGALSIAIADRAHSPDHPHARGENTQLTVAYRRHADHPHARGETHRALLMAIIQHDGPSPRAWGARDAVIRRRRPAGPSPRAWGARFSSGRRRVSTDHPHARGENVPYAISTSTRSADHPHARGENADRCAELSA